LKFPKHGLCGMYACQHEYVGFLSLMLFLDVLPGGTKPSSVEVYHAQARGKPRCRIWR
jgi:hypothetical protein